MIAAAHSSIGGLVVIGCVVVAAIINAILKSNSRGQGQRMRDFWVLRDKLGFEDFNPGPDEEFARGWGFLDTLSQGTDRYAIHILRGTYKEEKLFVFDYRFQTGSGKSRQDHNCTMLMLVFKQVFPQLTIGPENFGLRIAEAVGLANDIKFESGEFSRKFCVRSPDKKFAYDICNPQMIDYLLGNPALHIEIQGPCLLLSFEPQLPAAQIEFNLQRLAQIRALMPDYLFTTTE